jgi:hypothetical protein
MTEPTSTGIDADVSPASASSAGASPDSASVWEDFIDIFYAPSKVFARRSTSSFIIPMLVVVIAVGALFIANSGVLASIVDAGIAQAIAKRPNASAQEIEMMRTWGPRSAKIGVFIGTPISIFITGLALWLVGKLFEAKETLGQAVMVASYASIPRIVEGVATSVQGLLLDTSRFTSPYNVSIGLARFFDPETTSPALLALIGRVDLFKIWMAVLLAIGLSVTGKIPRARAAIAAAIIWLASALPLLLQAR